MDDVRQSSKILTLKYESEFWIITLDIPLHLEVLEAALYAMGTEQLFALVYIAIIYPQNKAK